VFFKKIIIIFVLNSFLVFLYRFNMLKINLKNKKNYYFNIFLSKNFKNNRYLSIETGNN